MGTGSGYLASIAARYGGEVIGADVNPKAVAYAREHHPLPNVRFVLSDLFSEISGEFDLILFNSPYLPSEEGVSDLDGGPEGNEVIIRFLKEAKKHLAKEGVILLLFSSLSKRDVVDASLKKEGYTFSCIATSHAFFETLFVYEITGSLVAA